MAQQLQIQGRFGYRHIQLIKTRDYLLGIGSYGAVYRAKCDNLPCAAKVLHPILFETGDHAAYRIVQRFEQECEFLSGMRHPNIIQYLGTCRDPESGLPVLFMELMDESLTSFLERPEDPPPLPLHIQVNIAHDVTQALAYLHCHEILHRDLSSNNVLMIGSSRAKVTDFGMAKLVENHPRTYCPGTQDYMSPQAMGDPPAYTMKLDIFSCGVLFVQIITRKFPNPGPRTHTVELNDPQAPSGHALVEVPELERRRAHLDLIDPAHPLLRIALDCLKDKEGERPTAEQLCSRLTAPKESLQRAPGDTASPTPRARDEELEQRPRERVEDLALEWKNGPKVLRPIYGHSIAVSGGVAYVMDVFNDTTVVMYNSEIQQWTVLLECPKVYFSIAVVNGLLTAIGGSQAGRATKTLVSCTSQPKWTEQFPPMTYCRNSPAVACTGTSLIVAGGWGQDKETAPVEVMDTKTLHWSTVASLPHVLLDSTATICGGRMYIAGGNNGEWIKSVLMCEVRDLLQSATQPQSPAASGVWRTVAELPVTRTSLVTLRGQLLAIGGDTTSGGETSDVRQYDAATDSWKVISHMNTKRYRFFAAVLPNDRVLVVGGAGSNNEYSAEIASVL